MNKETSDRVALITVQLEEQYKRQLRRDFPDFCFKFCSANTAADIPDDIWMDTEILFTGGNFSTNGDYFPRLVFPDPNQAPKLRWMQLITAGANQAFNQPLFKTHVLFTTSSGVHAINIAEYVLTTILAWCHRLPQMQAWQRKGQWIPEEVRNQTLMPEELHGKTIGIVGYGSIGREIARKAKNFDMHIIAMQRSEDHHFYGFPFSGIGDPDGKLPERYYKLEQFHDLLGESDIVVIALPLTTHTKYLFDAKAFAAMKKSAFLVNIARGEICDEDALIGTLQEKRIAGAALDVFCQEPLPGESPLWQLPNVFIGPHIAGLTPHYEERAFILFQENLRRYSAGIPLYNVVDKLQK